ncbi:MAG: hypothetical protein KGZ96_00180 [Clostridia bacterium]|nr:hypothetical protein [Clostridia bacterium]
MTARKGKMTRIYPGSNTWKGFYSFYDSVLSGLDKVYVLKGGPGTGKSTLSKRIGLIMSDRGFDVELLCCSSDNNSLDGVIIPQIKVGVVDGTAPHVIDPKYPGVVEEIINLGEFWDSGKLETAKEEIINICNKKTACYFQAYKQLEQAHEQWALSQENNKGLSDETIKGLVAKLGQEIFTVPKPRLRQMFAGAITPNGPVHSTKEIVAEYKKKLRLTGGTRKDKSRFLQQMSLLALEKGYDADLYHCFFDPEFHSMLLMPKMKLALIDNYLPYLGQLLNEDEFNGTILLGEEDIREPFSTQAAKHLEKAVAQLKGAKLNHEELEKYYVQAMNYEGIDQVREKLISKILNFANRT